MRYNTARVVMDHDESIRAEGDYWFKDFTRVIQSFVEDSLADRNNLDDDLLRLSLAYYSLKHPDVLSGLIQLI
jgi:hypothetical protein